MGGGRSNASAGAVLRSTLDARVNGGGPAMSGDLIQGASQPIKHLDVAASTGFDPTVAIAFTAGALAAGGKAAFQRVRTWWRNR